MPAQTFDYADYHRTIIGFHGTTAATAEDLVAGKAFKPSESDDDWFGKGICFWEYAPKQAWWWARKFKKYADPAVVGAIIRLGNCFDLLDPVNVQTLKEFRDSMIEQLNVAGIEVPTNFRQHKKQDCAVFNFIYQQAKTAQKPSTRPGPSTYRREITSAPGKGVGFMKKPTSKSVSATPATSLPSGTSAPTGATANGKPKKAKQKVKFGVLVKKVKSMTTQQFRKSLVAAGIIDDDGKLTEKYR